MSYYSQCSPYSKLVGDPDNWIYEPPVLSASVGWQQPNFPEDVLLIQRILNIIIAQGYLEDQAVSSLEESGSWDDGLDNALGYVEARYLSGMASPFGQKILDNGSPLFRFLVDLAAGNANLITRYSPMLYQLAHVMLPGSLASKNLARYLSNILQALAFNGIADTQMVLVALATIAAESSTVGPVSEGVSKYNSSFAALRHAPGAHTFDLYDRRADLGNRGSPDGASFKGRGFVQLTGREHYTKYASMFRWPLVEKPDTANDAWAAAMLLGRYLKDHESTIRDALRRGDMRSARRAVNGGSHHLDVFTRSYRDGQSFLQNHLAGSAITRRAATAALSGK